MHSHVEKDWQLDQSICAAGPAAQSTNDTI
jgi:hypothetical protein